VVLDGLSRELVWGGIEEGGLRALARLREVGRWGELTSVIPPATAPAVASLLTGASPEVHGVRGFSEFDRRAWRIRLKSFSDLRLPTVAEYADSIGISAGLLGIPLLYPTPRLEKGFAVAGFGVPNSVKWAEPQRVYEELRSAGYLPSPKMEAGKSDEKVAERKVEQLWARWEAYRRILDEWIDELRLLIVWIVETDHAAHRLWHRRDLMMDVYRAADEIVNRLLREYLGGWFVQVVSDHGFSTKRRVLYPNSVLRSRGLLRLKLSPKTILREMVTDLVEEVRERFLGARLTVMRELGRPSMLEAIIRTLTLGVEDVDREESVAISIGEPTQFFPVYILADDPEERKVVEKRVVEIFSSIPEVREILPGDPMWIGVREDVSCVPGTLRLPANPAKRLVGLPGVVGEHELVGVFFAAGPHVSKGPVRGMRIVDVGPTALHYLGLPLLDFMDGEARTDLFEPGSPPREAEKRRISSEKLKLKVAVARAVARARRNMGAGGR